MVSLIQDYVDKTFYIKDDNTNKILLFVYPIKESKITNRFKIYTEKGRVFQIFYMHNGDPFQAIEITGD
jgi:hypothetical protein